MFLNNIWHALALLPGGILRPELYVLALKGLGYAYLEIFVFTFIAILMYVLIVYSAVSIPGLFTKKKKANNHKKAQKVLDYLKIKKLSFLIPVIIFLFSAIPFVPFPPIEALSVIMVKVLKYEKPGLIIIFFANLLRCYIIIEVLF